MQFLHRLYFIASDNGQIVEFRSKLFFSSSLSLSFEKQGGGEISPSAYHYQSNSDIVGYKFTAEEHIRFLTDW